MYTPLYTQPKSCESVTAFLTANAAKKIRFVRIIQIATAKIDIPCEKNGFFTNLLAFSGVYGYNKIRV